MSLDLEKLIKCGSEPVTVPRLPQTPRARKVIQYAVEEARELKHTHVGTEHMLLGLFRCHAESPLTPLTGLNISFEGVRKAVAGLYSPDPPCQAPRPRLRTCPDCDSDLTGCTGTACWNCGAEV